MIKCTSQFLLVLSIFSACNNLDSWQKKPSSHGLDSTFVYCFHLDDAINRYKVFNGKSLDDGEIILLTDTNLNVLDTAFVGFNNGFYVSKVKDAFFELRVFNRSPSTRVESITRFYIVNNKMVPIYEYNSYFITKWKEYTRDAAARVVSRTERQSYRLIVSENNLDLPNELRLVKYSLEQRSDTLEQVLAADTSFEEIKIVRDFHTGVYMERYLTKEEMIKAQDTFDYDSIPYLEGEYYNHGKWNSFPIF